jgi:MFS-type transporter involved in bile tolerance (Atg22 family)
VPGLLRFLVARFFYTDPVNTVIVVMAVFATEAIGLSKGQANLVLLLLTVVAVVASFGWGAMVERFGPSARSSSCSARGSSACSSWAAC